MGGSRCRPVRRSTWIAVLVSVLLILVLPALALGSGARMPDADATEATLTVLAGSVTVIATASGTSHLGVSGETLHSGDRVVTATPGGALLTFFDGSEQELDAGSDVQITALGSTGGGTLTALAHGSGVTINRVSQLAVGSSYEVT